MILYARYASMAQLILNRFHKKIYKKEREVPGELPFCVWALAC